MEKTMRYILIVAIGIILLGLACTRQIESEDLEYGLPDAPPIPDSLSVLYQSDVVVLSWSADVAPGEYTYAVYIADEQDGLYSLYETTTSFTSKVTSLTAGRVYYLKVSAITSGGLEGQLSEAMEVSPGVFSMQLNNGSEFTNSQNTIVSFVIPQSALLLMLSEDPTFTDAEWRNFSPSIGFELSEGEGMKYVYGRVRLADGYETDPAGALHDSIYLDQTAEIDSVYFDPNDIDFAADSVVTFYLVTSEAEGSAWISFPGMNSLELDYNESLSDPGSSFHVYNEEYIIPTGLDVVGGTVTGYFRDIAGNVADPVRSSTLLNIANDPIAVLLAAVTETSAMIRLTWSENNNSDFAAYHLYRGLDSDISNDTEPVAVIDNRNILHFNDDGLEESTEYFYRLYVYDNTGQFAGSNVTSAITLTNIPPVPVVLAGYVEISLGDTLISLNWTESQETDFESYRIYSTGDTTLPSEQWSQLGIINNISTTEFGGLLPSPLTPFYQVTVFDRQGKSARSNWVEISL
jgi:fibronectin type 3 domain-containing protein